MFASGSRPTVRDMGIWGRSRRWWRRHEPQYVRTLSLVEVVALAVATVLTLLLVAYTLGKR
jgi:hypothetical protein